MTEDNNTASTSVIEGILRHLPKVSVAIYCTITVVGILGNGLVIYVTCCKMKRTVNSVWFLNLALADFLFTAFLIFSTISLHQEQRWPFGSFMCKLNSFVTVVSMFASIFFLTAISLDRCLSTWVAIWAHNKRTVCKAQLTSAVVWALAVVCSSPYAALRYQIKDESNGNNYCTYEHDPNQQWILTMFRFIVGFVIPFLAIFLCYVSICAKTRRLHGIRKQRSRRIIFAVIVAFFICWLPFHISQLVQLTDGHKHEYISKIAGTLTVSLAFLNSCLNPILYVFMCDEFQKKVKRSICFVLESALAEDQLSFMSSRSLTSHLSRVSRKSVSTAPVEPEVTPSKVIEEREMMNLD